MRIDSGKADSAGSSVRLPAVAGMFYPDEPVKCRGVAEQLLQAFPRVGRLGVFEPTNSAKWMGALIPHAGWICSGAIAGETIRILSHARPEADVVVVFGAIHTPIPTEIAVLDSHDQWATPCGNAATHVALRNILAVDSDHFETDDRFHDREHAVEVELPLVQLAWPKAALLPVEVPAVDEAVEIGRRTAEAVSNLGLQAVYLASSDLTHYGPAYRFTPAGVGMSGLQWAKENDRRLLNLIVAMDPAQIVPETSQRLNACGGGAIAAMMSACASAGASRAILLRHANSFQTLAAVAPQPPDNAVGYAGMLAG